MFDNQSYSNTWPRDHAGPRGPGGEGVFNTRPIQIWNPDCN
jgi:hypothetical protein